MGAWSLIVEGANTYSPDPNRKAGRTRMEQAVYRQKGVMIATDYLVNSGGVIFAAQEQLVPTPPELQLPAEMLGDRPAVEAWLEERSGRFRPALGAAPGGRGCLPGEGDPAQHDRAGGSAGLRRGPPALPGGRTHQPAATGGQGGRAHGAGNHGADAHDPRRRAVAGGGESDRPRPQQHHRGALRRWEDGRRADRLGHRPRRRRRGRGGTGWRTS